MEWTDQGIVIARRPHGESAAIVTVFAREHGRHLGLMRGRRRPEPGSEVAVHWRARLEEHLGTMTLELIRAHGAVLLDDPGRLAALSAACALLDAALPERNPYPDLHAATVALLVGLEAEDWAARFVRWEVLALAEFGFGMMLDQCALTGARHDLTQVSPRTGRAVSATAAAPYEGRLLDLPGFLADPAARPSPADILKGLTLTGHFLERFVLGPGGKRLPAARTRLVDRWRRAVTLANQ